MNSSIKIMMITLLIIFAAGTASPHCDGVDGPVVQAALKSLETEDISYVLIWIKKEHEQKIRNAFTKTLKVRKLGPEAKEVADHHFLETIVRIHREGEGEPFTGIKAAGRDLGPVIPAADRSVDSGSLEELKNILSSRIFDELDKKFNHLKEKKEFSLNDYDSGREYVQAYVEYLHYAENLYKAAGFTPHGGSQDTNQEEHHH